MRVGPVKLKRPLIDVSVPSEGRSNGAVVNFCGA